jgi:hypothetical protein
MTSDVVRNVANVLKAQIVIRRKIEATLGQAVGFRKVLLTRPRSTAKGWEVVQWDEEWSGFYSVLSEQVGQRIT